MNDLALELLWRAVTLPFSLAARLVRMIRNIAFWRTAYAPRVRCRNCGASISLVGIWECHCHFTYRGHLLRECPICGSLPSMVKCFNCGVTERLPKLCD